MKEEDVRLAKINISSAFYGEYSPFYPPVAIRKKVDLIYDCLVEIARNKGKSVLRELYEVLCLVDEGKINDSDIISFNI